MLGFSSDTNFLKPRFRWECYLLWLFLSGEFPRSELSLYSALTKGIFSLCSAWAFDDLLLYFDEFNETEFYEELILLVLEFSSFS